MNLNCGNFPTVTMEWTRRKKVAVTAGSPKNTILVIRFTWTNHNSQLAFIKGISLRPDLSVDVIAPLVLRSNFAARVVRALESCRNAWGDSHGSRGFNAEG